MPLEQTRRWTQQEFASDSQQARGIFRDKRLEETLDDYEQHYRTAEALFRPLLERLHDVVSGNISYEDMSALVRSKDRFQAFCYLGGPPISADDMETLSGAKKSTALWTRPADVELIRDTMARAIDPVRFPWLAQNRPPTATEMDAAALASGTLVAQSKVGTARRNEAKKDQEEAVMAVLAAEGFEAVCRRTINIFADAPPPGSFCPESVLGGTKGDVIVTLRDRRFMAIECKSSNSEVNSYKRLNLEAAGKGLKWLGAFGSANVVPAAVLSGVFKVGNLETAQNGDGLTIFWQHRLDDLAEFVRRAA